MTIKFTFGGCSYSYDLPINKPVGIAHEAGHVQMRRTENGLQFRWYRNGWGNWLTYDQAKDHDGFPKRHIDKLIEQIDKQSA